MQIALTRQQGAQPSETLRDPSTRRISGFVTYFLTDAVPAQHTLRALDVRR